MSVPVQMLVTQGRFRDNRRGQLTVAVDASDLATITIDQPANPDQGLAATTTRLVLSGAHLEAFRAQLDQACGQEARRVSAAAAVRQLRAQPAAS